jgi:hypothetical protein
MAEVDSGFEQLFEVRLCGSHRISLVGLACASLRLPELGAFAEQDPGHPERGLVTGLNARL